MIRNNSAVSIPTQQWSAKRHHSIAEHTGIVATQRPSATPYLWVHSIHHSG
jgi:hypothetical protein